MRPSPHITIRGAMVIAAGLAGLGASGCSFLFSEGPPADRTPRPFLTCGESYAPPVIDTVVAGVLGLALAGSKRNANQTEAQYQGAMAAVGTFGILTAAGAIYGYNVVASCREAKQARAVESWRAAWLPPPYGVGPQGMAPRVWPPPLPPSAPPASSAPVPRPDPPAPVDEAPAVIVAPPSERPAPTP